MANIDINGLPWMLVGDITVGTATTSVSFTGLTISKDDDYLLVSEVINSQASIANYQLFYNNNVTPTNYYNQYLGVSNTASSVGRANGTGLCYMSSAGKMLSVCKIKLTNSGYCIHQSNESRNYGGASTELSFSYITSTFTVVNITALTVTCALANGIGIGSRFQLYKCVAEKVADITVATATTSVSISGLNIDKTGEYMLVGNIYTTNSYGFYLHSNGNNTNTNYYYQYIMADSTSVSGSRGNSPMMIIGHAGTAYNHFNNLIKLTNNGYITWQSSNETGFSTTAPKILNINGTSTFTATSITSLTVTGESANLIGIGSRFQLYKMK